MEFGSLKIGGGLLSLTTFKKGSSLARSRCLAGAAVPNAAPGRQGARGGAEAAEGGLLGAGDLPGARLKTLGNAGRTG